MYAGGGRSCFVCFFFKRDANPRCIRCVAFFKRNAFPPPGMSALQVPCVVNTLPVFCYFERHFIGWLSWCLQSLLWKRVIGQCKWQTREAVRGKKEKLFRKLRLSLNPEIWIYSLSTHPCSAKITVIVIIYDLWASRDSESEVEPHSKRSFTLKHQKCVI